ncbi:MAG: Imm39 family immunity protein [Candidatus Latescibacterota bacterium]|nr:Imm39 family immunity protein [Candidatus Latescibacterota bacterium]
MMDPKQAVERQDENPKIVIDSSSLTQARVHRQNLMALRETGSVVDELLRESAFCDSTPFTWITLMIRLGLVNEEAPHYERIHRRYRDLPLAIEIDTHEVYKADLEVVKRKYLIAALKAVIHAGKKHRRRIDLLEDELARQLAADQNTTTDDGEGDA